MCINYVEINIINHPPIVLKNNTAQCFFLKKKINTKNVITTNFSDEKARF